MITNKTIYQVDAFTDEPFKGNPAGVMIIDETVQTEWMQNMAMEMNLSETAFVLPTKDDFIIHYFTPVKEVPLCGHATLAAAHIIYELGLKNSNESISFRAKGADLRITKEADGIVMNFPSYPLTKIETALDFKETIGFEPIETYASIYDWIITVAQTEAEIANATPNFEKMKTNGLGHLMITAISDLNHADFVLRCFAPSAGINEDPVTGSAHCALTPLWSEKLGKNTMNSFQLSKRTGKLKVKMLNNRVEIKGNAITILEAEIKI